MTTKNSRRGQSQRQVNVAELAEEQNPVNKIELPADQAAELTDEEHDELGEAISRQQHDIDIQVQNNPELGLEMAVTAALDQQPVVEEPAPQVKQETKEIGKGVTITSAKKVNGDIRMYLDSADIEGFIRSKYKLEPADYPLGLTQTVAGINKYINTMRNGVPVTPAEGLRHQMAWLLTVTSALDGQYDHAKACYDVILFTANRYRNDLFNNRLAGRFYNLMHDDTQSLFLAVQSVIMGSCDPRGRKAFLQTTNLEKISSKFKKPAVSANFLAFYAA